MGYSARVRWGAGLVMSLAMGCGFNVGDIDRTQPDKVEKAMFQDGKPWFFRQTIIDLPATSQVSFIGEQGGTHKILWQIDEQFLYAYRAHEQLKGGEEYQQRPGVQYRGSPVAAFRILSHFDVQREYNPSTGEQTNVISENMNDRPWNERAYMRVDWSNNLISDFTFTGASVAQQPVARYVREGEADKDAAKITPSYLDIVHELVAEPEINEMYSDYFGFPIPSCWLYNAIYVDCLGSRVKIRSSFMKAAEDYVYEPLQFDDHKFAKFGYFRTDRYGYDRHYDVVDTQVDYFIERFNLWKQRPGEESCRDDMLPAPYANCGNEKIKPIVYYVNEGFPEYLRDANARMGAEWNRVFKESVSAMTGRPVDQLPDVFIMCPNNPVQAGDPTECGAPGLNPQIGDLRYSMVYYVLGPQEASPLGYGPHAPDPLTGEVLSANAFMYGGALETYAQYALDMVKLQTGDLTINDLYNGQNIVQHYQRTAANRADVVAQSRMDPDQFRKMANKMNIREKASRLREAAREGRLSQDSIRARLQRVRGSDIESALITPDVQKALLPQFASLADVPEQMRSMISPSTLLDPTFLRMGKEREFKLSRATVDMAEFFDDGLAGWARRFSCDPATSDAADVSRFCLDDGNGGLRLNEAAAYQFVLEEIYIGVTLHEVGHNVGLRHNFAGTTDSINYFKKYWELRGYTRRAGDSSLRPEFNLTTNAEINGLERAISEGLREYQYSSIMDYGAKPNSDVQGLGLYDKAAILYGYGQMVEVWDPNALTPAKLDPEHDAPLLVPVMRHYTAYPDIVAGDTTYNYGQKIEAMYARKAVPETAVQTNTSLVEVPYRFCSDEYVNGVYHCYRFDQGADAYEQVMNNAAMYENYYVFNGMRRNRVGFGMNVAGYLSRIYGRYFEFLSAQNKHFLNDNLINHFYDSGCEQGLHFIDPKCGMDRFVAAIEAVNALGRVIQTPEPGCYVRRKPGCYLDSFDSVNGLPVSVQKRDDAFCMNPGNNPGGRVTQVKADDAYTYIDDSLNCDAWRPLVTEGGGDVWEPAMEIGLGDGRYALDKYNHDAFGYGFYWKPVTIGAWWDKWLAMQTFGDPWTDFIGVDARGDSRSFLISFNSLYRNDIATAVGAFIAEDPRRYGPYIEMVNGQAKLRKRRIVQAAQDALSNFSPAHGVLPAGAIALNPEETYSTRLQALFIGSAYYSQITDDQDFNEALFIGKAGSEVDVLVPADVKMDPNRYVEITDPVTGYIYYAVKNVVDASWFLEEAPFYSTGYEYLRRVRDENMTADGKNLLPGKDVGTIRGEIRMWEIIRANLRAFGYNYAGGLIW